MPRPRTVDDGTVFAAVAQVIGRTGPAGLTLAGVAKVAGLAAPTLVQRYGSKLGMLRAMSKAARSGADTFVDQLRAQHRTPLALSRAFVLCFAGMAPTPEVLANHTLAYLQIDLADPVMRRSTLEMGEDQERVLAGLLREAVTKGELVKGTDPIQLAQILLRAAIGSLLAWALHRTESAHDWLARDVDAILAPYRKGRG